MFNGLLIAAIIYPYDIIKEDFTEKMETIARLTERELKQRDLLGKNRASLEGKDQRTLFEDEEDA